MLVDPPFTATLGRLLYVSALAPGVRATEVGRIVSTARARNAQDGITGLLIFDGDTFCQYVEGPPEAVDDLLARLHRDPRHGTLDILMHDRPTMARRFSDWRLGYVESVETDDLDALRGLRGEDGLAALEALLPRLDVED